MDGNRFDDLVRSLTGSRRSLLGGGLVAVVGWLGVADVGAKKKRRRKKRPRFNQFGCVDVGGKCFGKDASCCSGICEGKKTKSRCVAHHEEGCIANQSTCAVSVAVLCGDEGRCYRTTGNAGFCASQGLCDCAPCKRDGDCERQFGPGAACIVCADCVGVNGSNGTGCVPAAT